MIRFLTRDEAYEATKPFHDAYRSAVHHAWDLWAELTATAPKFTRPLDSTARYKFLNCHMTDEIERTVPHTIRVNGGPGMLVQTIPDKATVRFKHLAGADMRPEYHSSIRQDELARQAYTPEFLEQLQIIEPTTALVAGYTLDPGESKISQIAVVCHYYDMKLYDIPLLGEGGAEMIAFPGLEPTGPTVSSGIAHEKTDDSVDDE